MLVFVLQWLSLHWEILIMLLSQFPLTLQETQNRIPRFIAWLLVILVLIYINDLPNDVICNISIYADDTTLYSKCDQAFDLWQKLELASELESDLRDTVDWSRK